MKDKLRLCLDVIVREFYLNMYISKELMLYGLYANSAIFSITYVFILPMNAMCFLLRFVFSKDPRELYCSEIHKQKDSRINFNIWIRREHGK